MGPSCSEVVRDMDERRGGVSLCHSELALVVGVPFWIVPVTATSGARDARKQRRRSS